MDNGLTGGQADAPAAADGGAVRAARAHRPWPMRTTQPPPPAPTPGERQVYTVQEGDTLSGIAARFGVSEDAILKENPLSEPDRLLVGQELVIPPAQP